MHRTLQKNSAILLNLVGKVYDIYDRKNMFDVDTRDLQAKLDALKAEREQIMSRMSSYEQSDSGRILPTAPANVVPEQTIDNDLQVA